MMWPLQLEWGRAVLTWVIVDGDEGHVCWCARWSSTYAIIMACTAGCCGNGWCVVWVTVGAIKVELQIGHWSRLVTLTLFCLRLSSTATTHLLTSFLICHGPETHRKVLISPFTIHTLRWVCFMTSPSSIPPLLAMQKPSPGLLSPSATQSLGRAWPGHFGLCGTIWRWMDLERGGGGRRQGRHWGFQSHLSLEGRCFHIFRLYLHPYLLTLTQHSHHTHSSTILLEFCSLKSILPTYIMLHSFLYYLWQFHPWLCKVSWPIMSQWCWGSGEVHLGVIDLWEHVPHIHMRTLCKVTRQLQLETANLLLNFDST